MTPYETGVLYLVACYESLRGYFLIVLVSS